MLTQTEFTKQAGISYGKLKAFHEEGKFLPKAKPLTGSALLYTNEQVEELKDIMKNYSNTGLTTRAFAKEVGVSEGVISSLNKKGILKEDHRDIKGYSRYTEEQVEKYLAGEYDPTKEEGFYNRQQIASLFGVSLSLVGLWCKKDLFKVDHTGFRGTKFYKIKEVEEIYKDTDLWLTEFMTAKKTRKMLAEQS